MQYNFLSYVTSLATILDNLWYHFRMCQRQIERCASENIVDIGEKYIETFHALFRREDSELVKQFPLEIDEPTYLRMLLNN